MNILRRLLRTISSWQTRRRWRQSQTQQTSTNEGSPHGVLFRIAHRLLQVRYFINSLIFNTDHANASRLADSLLEPLFWFVDNYTHVIGPAFVVAVFLLTSVVVGICYYIGLPWWWNTSPTFTVFLVILGNWLLLNVTFHYFMATFTDPGKPPEGIIPNAYGICKKCMAPKPPRTHHCSVCKTCILKMDHHCPWLNQCVGFWNHRYFFLYMAYTSLGIIFIAVFGCKIGYEALWLYADDETWTETENEKLVGHPVRFNLTGHVIPVTEMNDYEHDGIYPRVHNLPEIEIPLYTATHRRMVLFMALTCIGVLLSLGILTIMHAKQIHRGETSIEVYKNKDETERLAKLNRKFINPYDFGPRENWRIFLGLSDGRTFVRHILFPSRHKPEGNGLVFRKIWEEQKTVWT